MTTLELTPEKFLKQACRSWWLGKPERRDKMTLQIYSSWYGMTDEIVFSNATRQKQSFFFPVVVHTHPITLIHTHCNLSFNQTNAIPVSEEGIAHRGYF